MSTNTLNVTVVGWAASTPREIVGDGVPFTSFRLATTPRRYDNRQGAWTDGQTEWITVKVFRDTAFNVATSIIKGQPVIVHGRLQTDEWVGDKGPRTTLVLEAVALGHDLTRGTAKFARTVYAAGAARVEPADDDAPEEAGAGGLAGLGVAALVDPWATDGASPSEDEELDEDADEEVGLVTS